MDDDVKTLGDYISIAWRRKFYILIPFIVVLFITIITVLSLPRIYQSSGTILIESQQIPSELVQSMVTSFADERIQIIQQRIMAGDQLFAIINKFNLYSEDVNKMPRSAILNDIRNRISIVLESANLRNQQRGSSAVISFTVAFQHSDPVVAQKVTNELVTLFLDENIKTRTARAEETTEFLKKESARLGAKIAVMEGEIASFTQENEGSLPENLRVNLERVVTLKGTLLATDSEMNELTERRNLLQIDLETLRLAETASGGLTEEQQQQKRELQELKNQYVSLSARYGSEHPDVRAIKRQIKAFEDVYGNLSSLEELQTQEHCCRWRPGWGQ